MELEATLAQVSLLATQDELTGLTNRRQMLELIHIEMTRQLRAEGAICLAMIDLDHFKVINDKYGHAAGDDVLQAFAQAVSRSLRGADVLARWGGEEFLLMLPDTTLPEAALCVQRMHENVRQLNLDTVKPGLTFSAGLSACASGTTLDEAIERADRAMYLAKAQGRNRTTQG